MSTKKDKIISFLNDQITQVDFRANAYVFDKDNQKKPQRNIFIKLKSYLDKFLNDKLAARWISLTGLRGAGKTTLLYQLYHEKKNEDCYKLILSVDQVTQIIGSNINEVISVYEELIGRHLETLDKPLLLFLDEVQYDPQWGIALKSIFDRSNKVFIFATGSAALQMNSNTDIARRTIYEKLFPLSFTEYLKIQNTKYEKKGLGKKTREILFSSQNAKEIFNGLQNLEKEANQYYLGATKIDFQKYFHYGSLPFMIALQNEALIYDQINKTLDRVINNDISQLGHFSSEIISKIPAILYAVADMDAVNFSKLAGLFEISRPKIAEIFSILEQTEILHRIYPYGSHLNQVTKKPSKYLFSSPAFRAMYYKMIGNTISQSNANGKLFEDLIGMYLHRVFYKNTNSSLTYDSAQRGADFILGIPNKKIVIEVGAGKKDFRQIIETSKKTSAAYSLIISSDELEFSKELNAVKVPTRLFLLV